MFSAHFVYLYIYTLEAYIPNHMDPDQTTSEVIVNIFKTQK